jgi:hypothetical protein
MINIDILIRCEKCKEIVTVSNIYVDNKTSEEEYLIKEYECLSCNYINIKIFTCKHAGCDVAKK